jgi:hypothetical protein
MEFGAEVPLKRDGGLCRAGQSIFLTLTCAGQVKSFFDIVKQSTLEIIPEGTMNRLSFLPDFVLCIAEGNQIDRKSVGIPVSPLVFEASPLLVFVVLDQSRFDFQERASVHRFDPLT